VSRAATATRAGVPGSVAPAGRSGIPYDADCLLTQTGPVPDLWDVIVVGAGPAGSAAALSALRVRPGASVLLLDRADFPRDKSCGDGIAPQVLDVLAALGLGGVVDDFAPVSTLSIGYPPGLGEAASGSMARPVRVVPREVLDARLVAGACAAGAVLRRHTVRRLEVRPDRVVLDGDLCARTVVAADGAGSTLRRGLGLAPNGPGHVAVAIRGYAPVRADLREEQRITLGREDWPEYAWSFPIGDGRANIGYGAVLREGRPLSRSLLMRRLEELLPGVSHDARSWRAHHLPLSSFRPRQPDGRVLLAGDALSLVNPMTGEGIYYAVLSGACAGAAAVGGTGGPAGAAGADPGAAYRRDLRRRLGRHLRHTSTAAVLARRPWVVDGALRGATRHPAAFDALVELGLGEGLLTPRALLATAAGVRR
jgi:menaquinone-9 beta-reductase